MALRAMLWTVALVALNLSLAGTAGAGTPAASLPTDAPVAAGGGGEPSTEPNAGAGIAAAPDVHQAMTQEELSRRMKEAIERTKLYKVVYEDVLGEGPGHWDADPRYPTDSVNCIIWFQLLLAETYGRTPEEKQAVMDRIRYFGGQPGFAFRKHYLDHWTAFDPGPLVNVSSAGCPFRDAQPYHLELQPQHFLDSINFPCPLYHGDKTAVDLTLDTGVGLVQCGSGLAPGFYALFPVASDRYLAKYAGFSGPMAQVHFVLLEVPPLPAPGESKERDAAKFRVWHASTGSGKVIETELGSYVLHMWELFRGYLVYKIDPAWDWRKVPPLDAEGKALAACEATVKGHAGPLFEENARKATPAAPAH